MRILVLNAGSSSLKCALYECSETPPESGAITPLWTENRPRNGSATRAVLESLIGRAGQVDVVGHRIVNGGLNHRATTFLTAEVRAAIAAEAAIAPAHNRIELEAVDAVAALLGPEMQQIAVFDTSFHATLAPDAYVYPSPYEWFASKGIRRFGFHGISHQYATGRVAEMSGGVPARLLVCHLGNGASLCAVRNGRSIDTTMGFTPLEGLMMGTRCGSIDPGIILYLLRQRAYTPDQLDRILNKESGLLGISGISGDMRDVTEAVPKGNQRARLALDIYAHRLAREAGGMIAVLGGLDALAFTGGVGENSPAVREGLCRHLAFLGLTVDRVSNLRPSGDRNVAAPESAIPIFVVHADEEGEIARECRGLMSPA
jgi:acetate kinase